MDAARYMFMLVCVAALVALAAMLTMRWETEDEMVEAQLTEQVRRMR